MAGVWGAYPYIFLFGIPSAGMVVPTNCMSSVWRQDLITNVVMLT
jgi:hypothetical protein